MDEMKDTSVEPTFVLDKEQAELLARIKYHIKFAFCCFMKVMTMEMGELPLSPLPMEVEASYQQPVIFKIVNLLMARIIEEYKKHEGGKAMIPDYTKEGIDSYVNDRIPTGDFLYAVLTNNLSEAFARADHINIHHMFDIVDYCWNKIPADCWGSKAKVDKWLADRPDKKRAGEPEGPPATVGDNNDSISPDPLPGPPLSDDPLSKQEHPGGE